MISLRWFVGILALLFIAGAIVLLRVPISSGGMACGTAPRRRRGGTATSR